MRNYDYIIRSAGETILEFSLRLYQEINSFCAYCGNTTDSGRMVTEHVIPKSRGGMDDSSNYVTACRSCNGLKGSLTPDEWRRKISERAGVAISEVRFALELKQGHPIVGLKHKDIS